MDAVLVGTIVSAAGPVAGATVVISDEGTVIASGRTDDTGAFALPVDAGRYTVLAFHPEVGGARGVVEAGAEFTLSLTPAGCWGYVDLPDPAALTDEAFYATWAVERLTAPEPGTTRYRWFWDRPGAAPAVLTLDWTGAGLRSVVRVHDGDGWVETATNVAPRRARRVEQAIVRSGFWELEHLDTRGACRPAGSGGSAWTVEAWASPGYRAVYRVDPRGTPIAVLGWSWTRAVGWRVARRDFE